MAQFLKGISKKDNLSENKNQFILLTKLSKAHYNKKADPREIGPI